MIDSIIFWFAFIVLIVFTLILCLEKELGVGKIKFQKIKEKLNFVSKKNIVIVLFYIDFVLFLDVGSDFFSIRLLSIIAGIVISVTIILLVKKILEIEFESTINNKYLISMGIICITMLQYIIVVGSKFQDVVFVRIILLIFVVTSNYTFVKLIISIAEFDNVFNPMLKINVYQKYKLLLLIYIIGMVPLAELIILFQLAFESNVNIIEAYKSALMILLPTGKAQLAYQGIGSSFIEVLGLCYKFLFVNIFIRYMVNIKITNEAVEDAE